MEEKGDLKLVEQMPRKKISSIKVGLFLHNFFVSRTKNLARNLFGIRVFGPQIWAVEALFFQKFKLVET